MTINNIFTTKLIQLEDLSQVANLHKKAFTDSVLTKLGNEPIRLYYEWQLTGPHDCYAIGVFDQDNTLLGFCFSGVFRGSLSGFLQQNRKILVRYILTHPWLITNPLVLDRINIALRIFRKKPPKIPLLKKEQIRSFGILSIAVDPDRQGFGIGKIIMELVEKEAFIKGFSQMHLTVHPTNVGAVAFYEHCGWLKKNNQSGNWTGSMIKPITAFTNNSK